MSSISHIGYFPNGLCLTESEVSPISPTIEFSSNQIGMSLVDAMATYWKVKEWNVYAGNSELGIDVGSIFFEKENNGAENENDLVCGLGGSRYSYIIPPYEDPNGVAESLQVSIAMNWISPASILYNNLYYPNIEFFWFGNPETITNAGQIEDEDLRFFCEINWSPYSVKWRVEIFPKVYWEYNY